MKTEQDVRDCLKQVEANQETIDQNSVDVLAQRGPGMDAEVAQESTAINQTIAATLRWVLEETA